MPGFFVIKIKGGIIMNFKRKGFTLISMLIVIVITGILAAMMFISSSEAIATARAAAIIANLNTLKKAATQWYIDNREKVTPEGTVTINGKTNFIQNWQDSDIHLSSYLSGTGASNLQLTRIASSGQYKNTGTGITEMRKGDYGLYDGGTVAQLKDDGTWGSRVEYHRNAWYVGYRFMDSEEKVKEKVRGRMKSAGVFFATTDVHQDNVNEYDTLWMRVF